MKTEKDIELWKFKAELIENRLRYLGEIMEFKGKIIEEKLRSKPEKPEKERPHQPG